MEFKDLLLPVELTTAVIRATVIWGTIVVFLKLGEDILREFILPGIKEDLNKIIKRFF